jgi:hypothetical protein
VKNFQDRLHEHLPTTGCIAQPIQSGVRGMVDIQTVSSTTMNLTDRGLRDEKEEHVIQIAIEKITSLHHVIEVAAVRRISELRQIEMSY